MRQKSRESLNRLRRLAPRSNLVSWSYIREDWTVFYIGDIKDLSVRNWCRRNCKSNYAIYNNRCAFSDKKEAFRFSLMFGLSSIPIPLDS